MFSKLNDNLTSIDGEIGKLKTAVTHIERSKEAAQKAVSAAEIMTKEFREHTQKVSAGIESILAPHQELIAATISLTDMLSKIDFPTRLEAQAKEVRMLKMALFGLFGFIAICSAIIILMLK